MSVEVVRTRDCRSPAVAVHTALAHSIWVRAQRGCGMELVTPQSTRDSQLTERRGRLGEVVESVSPLGLPVGYQTSQGA